MKKQTQLVPRNPYVAAARFRKSGTHTKSIKASRQADKVRVQTGQACY